MKHHRVSKSSYRPAILLSCLGVFALMATSGVSAGSLFGPTPTRPAGNLILHWEMEETGAETTAADAIGNNNGIYYEGDFSGQSGPIQATPGSPYALTTSNACLDFSGTGDSVRGSSAAINNLSAITVAVWIKSRVTNTDRGFVNGMPPLKSNDKFFSMRYDEFGFDGPGCPRR